MNHDHEACENCFKLIDSEDLTKEIIALEEEWFLIIGEDNNDKACQITKVLLDTINKIKKR